MIKFGMTIAEMITQLTKGFIKATGRKPDGLEKIKIQQEANQIFKDQQKVVDMKGKTLDPDKVIVGGTQEGAALKSGILKATNIKPRAVPESLQKQIEQKYGLKLQGDETVDEIKKIIEDLPTDKKADGGRIGFKGGADMGTVSGDTRKATAKSVNISPTGNVTISRDRGPDPVDDRSTFEQTVMQRDVFDKPKENPIKNIIEAGADFNYLRNLYNLNPQGIAASFLLNQMGNVLFPDPEEKADGGRIGFKKGSMDRRTFMKIMGGLASIPILGRYFKGAEKAAPAAQKVMENFSSTASEAPTYFFDLVAKIKAFGKRSKVGPAERVDEYSYTGKNGDQYTLTEDITTGDAQITKDKMGIGTSGDKSFDVIEDRTVLEYKAPKKDVDPDTQKFIDEGAEYEEYKIEFDQDGTQAGADAIEETIQKEIIEESKKAAPPIKKAAGGLAYMLGE
jgi:hypothetical protein